MILIVDDNWRSIAHLKEALEDAGFQTLLVGTPDECMEVITSHEPIDAVVLDIMLPAGSFSLRQTDYGIKTGLVLLRKIRDSRPCLPVILHSVKRVSTAPEILNDSLTFVLPKSESTLSEIIESIQRVVQPRSKCRD